MARFLFVAILSTCCFGISAETRVTMNITPSNALSGLDETVDFSCAIQENFLQVFVVNINREDNEQIATLSSGSKLTFSHDDEENENGKNFQGHGVIDNESNVAYLNLTLTYPSTKDTGLYNCVVSYLNEQGALTQGKASANLNVSKAASDSDPMLEKVFAAVVRRLDHQNDHVKSLEKAIRDQSETIHRLENKPTAYQRQSAFSATFKDAGRKLNRNEVIIFDDVTAREGQGYNESSGVFTAPFSGLYAFHLTIGTWSSTNTASNLYIAVNDKQLARLETVNYVFNRHKNARADQNSISLVVDLSVGDTVKTVAEETTSLTTERIDGTFSRFSGYLIYPH